MPSYCYYGQFVVPRSFRTGSERNPGEFHVSGHPDSEMLPLSHQAGLGLSILFRLLWKIPAAGEGCLPVFCPSGQPLNEHLAMKSGVGWAQPEGISLILALWTLEACLAVVSPGCFLRGRSFAEDWSPFFRATFYRLLGLTNIFRKWWKCK